MGCRVHNPHSWLHRLQNHTCIFTYDWKGNVQQEILREKVGRGNQHRPQKRVSVAEIFSGRQYAWERERRLTGVQMKL